MRRDMPGNNYEGIKQVIRLSGERLSQCEQCRFLPKNLEAAINHYLSEPHNYRLLHLGTQSDIYEGNVFHDVTAVLGK